MSTTTAPTRTRIDVDPADVRPGDWADHKSGELDPRQVKQVDPEAGVVFLDFGSAIDNPPLALRAYHYYRIVPVRTVADARTVAQFVPGSVQRQVEGYTEHHGIEAVFLVDEDGEIRGGTLIDTRRDLSTPFTIVQDSVVGFRTDSPGPWVPLPGTGEDEATHHHRGEVLEALGRVAPGEPVQVTLGEFDTAWNPASTKPDSEITGPALVTYRRYVDGGVDAHVQDA